MFNDLWEYEGYLELLQRGQVHTRNLKKLPGLPIEDAVSKSQSVVGLQRTAAAI